MNLKENKDFCLKFYNAIFNEKRLDILSEFLSPDFIDNHPKPQQEKGFDGVKKIFVDMFESFPDFKMNPLDVFAEENKVIVRMGITGTFKKDFMGMPATGNSFSIEGIDILRIENGLLVERWGYFEDMQMMQQLTGQ